MSINSLKVGIVIDNRLVKHIEDIEPISDRLIRITLKEILPITIIGTYLPQAGRPEEETNGVQELLEKEIRKYKGRGPTYICGDMNARIQKAENKMEKRHIGNHTFEPESTPRIRTDMVQRNRSRLINICQT